MGKSNAERQANYRARKLKAGGGMQRLNILLSDAAKKRLTELANRYTVTQREVIEQLLAQSATMAVSGGWEFVDHACRHCTGRLLRRVNPDGSVVHRCAECGASAQGEHDALCCCGIEVRGHGAVFECFRNPNVSMAAPQEILVRERPVLKVPERSPGRISNPVKMHRHKSI